MLKKHNNAKKENNAQIKNLQKQKLYKALQIIYVNHKCHVWLTSKTHINVNKNAQNREVLLHIMLSVLPSNYMFRHVKLLPTNMTQKHVRLNNTQI